MDEESPRVQPGSGGVPVTVQPAAPPFLRLAVRSVRHTGRRLGNPVCIHTFFPVWMKTGKLEDDGILLSRFLHGQAAHQQEKMTEPFQFRALSEMLYDALAEDAFYIAMENSVPGGPVRRREAMLRYYDYSMREGRKYGVLYVPDGQAFGASIWSRPLEDALSRRMADEKKAFLKRHMGDGSLDRYEEITGCMAEQTATVLPPDCWYLSIVGIAPPFQGQGLGDTLLRPVLDRADERGVHTYLETFTPRNMRFYLRMGFRDAGAFDGSGTGARYWVMIRKPFSRASE